MKLIPSFPQTRLS